VVAEKSVIRKMGQEYFLAGATGVPLSFSIEGGLDGLPLRVSNEGLLRPRVARAQESI
jgi:hypothetical protein